ncbi:PorP/SprF family type IX secretion system membrane protein [Maribacter sp. 2304DJ31-5]|uniref:PorP/SprF family type IX secretion system membrane protein n=1 Tax=Maribacter sp. 2304DJ31-5 TaxID=3386273 RepID=UPI0039BD4E38
MKNFCGAFLVVFTVFGLRAQDVALPSDFRQHNLTEYNSSILNPAYALDRNKPSSIAFWSRWQWQVYDADPTSLFLNYTARINRSSVAGLGFFQHNTGIFLNTGGTLNYAYAIEFSPKITLGVGLNLFGYQQKLADDRFFRPNPIQTTPPNDFIVHLAPGINLKIDQFSIGFTSENLFDYNFNTNERNSSASDRIIFGLASYDIPLIMGPDDHSVFRPALYFKSIPGLDTQIGFTGLLSTSRFWAQAGYNSFYGISGGVGGRFFKRFSLGALVEFGTGPDLDGQDPSFELVTSYKFGNLDKNPYDREEELIAEEIKKEEKLKKAQEKSEKLTAKREARQKERLAKEHTKRLKDSIEQADKAKDIALKISKRDIKRRTDSINKAQREKALTAKMLEQRRIRDSIATVALKKEAAKEKTEQERLARKKEVVKVQAGEKYEEVIKEGTLEPGYYLIANVFGTKRYFEAFMADLKKKGLNPKSFYRERNRYNYVYLRRYDSISAARKARDSKFNRTYFGKTWIFRVVGE